MRSPPADIFVWGIHPDTTKNDIVADLAESGIIIAETDIEKKSREEAFLLSFRIRVKAEDLQKVLDPAIWPLRVKVREFIHFSSKNGPNSKKDNNDKQKISDEGQPMCSSEKSEKVGQNKEQSGITVVSNQYAVLNDNVADETQV